MAKLKAFFVGFGNFKQDVKVTGIQKYHFTKSEWGSFSDPHKISLPYMIWRGLFMGYFIFAVTNSMLAWGLSLFFTFLTNWSLCSQLLYSILFFIDHIFVCASTSGRQGKLVRPTTNNWLESIIWILFNIVATLPIFVTIGFWLTVYDPKVDDIYYYHSNTILSHGVNSILALIDIMLVALPVRTTHFIYLLSFASIYMLFSVLYEVGGGTYQYPDQPYIYPFLNWREKRYETLLACAVAMLVCCLLHCISRLNYIFRLFIVSSLSCREDKEYIYSYHSYHSALTSPDVSEILKKKNHKRGRNRNTAHFESSKSNAGQNSSVSINLLHYNKNNNAEV